jgi:hypothetical protein
MESLALKWDLVAAIAAMVLTPFKGVSVKGHSGIREQRIRTIFASTFERRTFLSSLSEANSRGFGRKATESSNVLGKLLEREDLLAVDAVRCKPLSAAKFPITGKNTGNS